MKSIYALFLFACITSFAFAQAPRLDANSARNFLVLENSPEAAVNFFYASRIRQDTRWQEAFLPETQWNNRVLTGLGSFENKRFYEAQILGKSDKGAGTVSVQVFTKVGLQNEVKTETADVVVKNVNGKWLVAELPQ